MTTLNELVQAWLAREGRSGSPLSDYGLSDPGTGPVISRWDEAKLGSRPSMTDLDSVRGQVAALAKARAADGELAAFEGAKVLAFIALDHENRLRAIEGRPPITMAQFRSALRAGLLA